MLKNVSKAKVFSRRAIALEEKVCDLMTLRLLPLISVVAITRSVVGSLYALVAANANRTSAYWQRVTPLFLIATKF